MLSPGPTQPISLCRPPRRPSICFSNLYTRISVCLWCCSCRLMLLVWLVLPASTCVDVAFVFALSGKLGTLTYWWALRLSRACLMHAAKWGVLGGSRGLRKDTMCVTIAHTPHPQPINETHQFLCGFGFFAPLQFSVFCVCVFDESEKCRRRWKGGAPLLLPVPVANVMQNESKHCQWVCVCVVGVC